MSIAASLVSASTQSGAPFTFGQAFKAGEVPAGQSVVCPEATTFQALAKNAWPDGSLKFAVLSGTADLTANTPLALTLSAGAAASGTALTTADLKATGITASVDAGAFGAVSWATTDWDSPAQTWCSGPVMSSWMYRKAVGSDAHLVAWLEVRLYAGGAVEVLPWIENGYVNVASPSNKSATYAFALGGSQRFSSAIDLKHHQRTVLISGAELSYWLGTDPGVTPLHDRAYLQQTELVPTYSATIASGTQAITSQPATYTPLQAGGFVYSSDDMTSTAYQRPIGLLPQHDAAYLMAPAADQATCFAGVTRNGYAPGRYGIHYRDENTQRPLRFSNWPTITIRSGQGFSHAGSSTTGTNTPVVTGGAPPSWDTAHSPSVGYFAYLLTGRYFFLEEAQFAATCNYLGNGSGAELRNGVQGLVQPCVGAWQVRAAAWMWRTLTQALTITPDADTTLRTELLNSVHANIDHFHGRYVAQPNNPFGFIQNAAGYVSNQWGVLSAWQQDFVTASFGYSMCMGLPLGAGYATKLSAFFHWTAQSIVGRLAAVGGGGWPYINASVYVLSISTATLPNWATGAGPWRADWTEVYSVAAATLASASAPSNWLGSTDGVLCGEIMPGATSMWGNLLPAIAYAVRHGVSGASTARNRVTAASNYSALATALNAEPVWAVAPASTPTSGAAMGKSLVIDTTDINGAGSLTIGDTGHGVLGSVIRSQTATGDSGAGVLYNDWDSSADDNSEFRLRVVTPPNSGSLFVNENGSFSLTGASAGARSWTYQLYVDGVPVGSPVTVNNQIGASGSATMAATLSSVTQALSARVNPRARIIANVGTLTPSMSAMVGPRATLVGQVGIASSSMSARVQARAQMSAILTNLGVIMSARSSTRADMAASVGALTASLSARVSPRANMAGQLAPLTPSMQAYVDAASVASMSATLQGCSAMLISFGPGATAIEPTGGFRATYKPGTAFRTVYRTRLPGKDPLESVLVAFDFSGECLQVSSPSMEVAVYKGTPDPDPDAILIGNPFVIGAMAYQRVRGGLHKSQYAIAAVVSTNEGDTLVCPAILPVLNKLA